MRVGEMILERAEIQTSLRTKKLTTTQRKNLIQRLNHLTVRVSEEIEKMDDLLKDDPMR